MYGALFLLFLNLDTSFVIFVDDFTRFTWMFLLRHKSDVFNVFVHFKALVENQFNTTIKVLRSNRGGEYDNHKFKSFCLWNSASIFLSIYTSPEWCC